MRFARSIMGATLLLAASGVASAQTAAPPLSTATLANLCSVAAADPETTEALGFCRGFLVGAWQYHVEITRPGGRPPIFCLPTSAPTMEAAQASFVAWVAANPQYGNDKALDGLMRWAATTYPCAPAAKPGKR